MKVSAATVLFCLAALRLDEASSSTLQRKRSGRGTDHEVRELVATAEQFQGEDNLLWERILQDAGMSIMPTGE